MQTLIMIAQLLTALSILVAVHELGHFLAAKAFGIRVDKFYLFFDFLFPMPSVMNFALFKKKIGETEYGLGWFPMGGYVQINGMVDESMNTEQLNQPPQPWEFRSKPAWQRIIVMLGGIIFNVILGIFIFAMISYHWGEKYHLNSSLKNGIVTSELAEESGFKTGDKLISVNGTAIVRFEEALNSHLIMADKITYHIEREGKEMDITMPGDFLKKLTRNTRSLFFTPRMEVDVEKVTPMSPAEKGGLLAGDHIIAINESPCKYFDEFQPLLLQNKDKKIKLSIIRGTDTMLLSINVDAAGKIGFLPTDKNFQYETVTYSLAESFPQGWHKAVEIIETQIMGWGKIFKGEIPVGKAVQGPVGIAQYFGPHWDWLNFWIITALISMGLAFANVLPIPALDGGHVVLLLVEMIIRRPLSIKFQERVQTVGLVILLSLMVLIFGNDIWNLFQK